MSGSQYMTRTNIDLKDCADTCDANKRCDSYEYSQKYRRCELNYFTAPNQDNTQWYDMHFCLKPEKRRAANCSEGYTYKPGQIPSTQMQVLGNILGSDACAALCDQMPGCYSYEHSKQAKQCQLNWDAEPSHETVQTGFRFCSKNEAKRDVVCDDGYEYKTGQNSQGPWLVKTSFEDGPAGCRKLCDEDEQCFSYEFSFKYKRCELSWRTAPNTESRWYDLQFCQKPRSKWPEVCTKGFHFMEGQTTSQYEVKTNIWSQEACGEYCAQEGRCLSYEYSVKYKRCELNTVSEPNIPASNWYDMKFCSKVKEE